MAGIRVPGSEGCCSCGGSERNVRVAHNSSRERTVGWYEHNARHGFCSILLSRADLRDRSSATLSPKRWAPRRGVSQTKRERNARFTGVASYSILNSTIRGTALLYGQTFVRGRFLAPEMLDWATAEFSKPRRRVSLPCEGCCPG